MSSALSPAAQISKISLTAVVIFIFFQGCLTIVAYQFFVNTIYHANAVEKQLHLNRSKKSFILLLVTILSIVAPSYVRITTENATIPKGTFRKNNKQRIVSSLKKKAVFISNHQIYTDWVFLWWLSYTSELAGNVIIMLKKSLESLPILGYGMKNYNFIFMNRKWELDRVTMANVLQGLDLDARGIGKLSGKVPSGYTVEGTEKFNEVPADGGSEWQMKWPYSLILFPEGTNMSKVTRIKSERYAERVGRKPLQHVLLPHTTGLRFALQKLAPSCEQVYDITVGYSGTTSDTYGEEMYNLRNVFFRGKAPALVDIHIRAFSLYEIPYNDEKAFEKWMHKIWEEKDKLMDIYYKHGSFDLDPELNHTVTGLCQVAPGEVAIILTVPLITSFLTSVMLTKLALFYFGR